MRRQEFRLLLSLFTASVIAVACAGEQQDNDTFSGGGETGGNGGKAGSTSVAGSTSGKGGTTGKGGSTNEGGSGDTGGGTSTAGTAGTAGSGGGTAGTGGTAGSGGTANMGDCDVGGAGFGEDVLSVDYKAANFVSTSQAQGNFQIHNDTDAAIPESVFSVRYYMTSEFDCEDAANTIVDVYDFRRQNPHDDSPGKDDVDTNVVVVGDNGSGCDIYIEFVFTIDLAVGQYAEFNFGTMPPNNDYNTPSDQSNDGSYGACTSDFVPWAATPLYIDGTLIWGEEPDVGGGGAGGAGGAGGTDAGGAPNGGVGGA